MIRTIRKILIAISLCVVAVFPAGTPAAAVSSAKKPPPASVGTYYNPFTKEIRLTWRYVPGANAYKVYVNGGKNGIVKTPAYFSPTITYYVKRPAGKNAIYVTTLDSSGIESLPSRTVTVFVPATKPAPKPVPTPAPIPAPVPGVSKLPPPSRVGSYYDSFIKVIKLTWRYVPEAAGYNVYVNEVRIAHINKYSYFSATIACDVVVKDTGKYSYQVKTVDSNGKESAASPTGTVWVK